MINRVTLLGNVGKDPEVRQVGDTQVAEFSLATSESYKDKNGERVTNTEWHNVTVWRGLAGVVEKYVKKGQPIYIEGKITTQTWEKDGEKKYKTVIVANEIKMLPKGSQTQGGQAQEEAPAQTGGTETDDLPF